MAILEMSKIRLFIAKSDLSSALQAIQDAGAVEFTKTSAISDLKEGAGYSDNNLRNFSSRLDSVVEFLEEFEESKNKIKEMFEGRKANVSEKDIEAHIDLNFLKQKIKKIEDIHKTINHADIKLKKLKEEEKKLQNWTQLNLPLKTEPKTKNTFFLFISGQEVDVEILKKELKKEEILFEIKRISQGHFFLSGLRKNKKEIKTLLTINNLEEEDLPKRRGTPKEELERINRAKKKIDLIKKEKEKKAAILANKYLDKFRVSSDYIYWHRKRLELAGTSRSTQDVCVFEGWCPSKLIPEIEKKIEEKTQFFALEKIEEKNEEPPVAINNPKAAKPFESITELYGVPSYKDLDPTSYMSIFFFLFFGLSLTDIGYGIILAVLSLSAIYFLNLNKDTNKFLKLISLGGISSIISGLFFGGLFGISIENMPNWMQKIAVFDPLASPIDILLLTLALGLLQVFFGLILKIAREYKNNNLFAGIAESGPWMLLFIGLSFIGLSEFDILKSSMIYEYMTYGSVGLIVLSGFVGSSPATGIFKGLGNLYGAVGFLSDILSYSRLLALGLATTALAFSVNLIAGLLNEMIPVIGGVVMVLVLLFGHLFNLVVNTLGAFIHSARLQFVEFFSKFIVESGREFKPFRRIERNIVITDK